MHCRMNPCISDSTLQKLTAETVDHATNPLNVLNEPAAANQLHNLPATQVLRQGCRLVEADLRSDPIPLLIRGSAGPAILAGVDGMRQPQHLLHETLLPIRHALKSELQQKPAAMLLPMHSRRWGGSVVSEAKLDHRAPHTFPCGQPSADRKLTASTIAFQFGLCVSSGAPDCPQAKPGLAATTSKTFGADMSYAELARSWKGCIRSRLAR